MHIVPRENQLKLLESKILIKHNAMDSSEKIAHEPNIQRLGNVDVKR